jgi:tRNA (cmo5U34)-methyltransferase
MVNEWKSIEHALAYLKVADTIPHRTDGEAILLEEVPNESRRILDLGSGDGRLLALLLMHCPSAAGVALDFSPLMLERLREKFGTEERVWVVEHDLDRLLPELGMFDVVASSFAIHHLTHDRKRELYTEVWNRLQPGGIFCNLEHVASPTERIHQRFLDALGIAGEEEDPSNKLLDVETQLRWLREIGFQDVDCFWKWRELALLVGKKAG